MSERLAMTVHSKDGLTLSMSRPFGEDAKFKFAAFLDDLVVEFDFQGEIHIERINTNEH